MSSPSRAAFSEPPGGLARAEDSVRARRSRRSASAARSSPGDWIILSLLLISPLVGVWLFGGVRLWSVGPLTALVFLAALVFALRRDPAHARLPPFGAGALLFLAYAVARVPGAAVPYEAHLDVLRLFSYALAFWMWFALAGRHGRWRWLAAGLLLSVSLMAWYAIIQHAHDSRQVLTLTRPVDYGMRASGAYFCPNHFANLLEMTVPFAVALVALPAAGVPLRLLAGYSILVVLPPLLLSQSRSGWIGTLVGVTVTVCVLGLRSGLRRFLARLAFVPAAAVVVALLVWRAFPVVQQRVADALQGNIRLALWRDTASMIADSPWWGFGPGSYRWVYPRYWHHMKTYLDPQFAHNDYLHLLAEYGAVGAVLLLGLVVWGLVGLLRAVRRATDHRSAVLLAGFAGSAAAAGVHACFDYNFHIYGNVHVLMLLGGLAAAVTAGRHDGPSASAQPAPRPWVRPALGAVALLLLLVTGRAVASYAFALKGDFRREVMDVDAAGPAYETARRIAPDNWHPHLGLGHLRGVQAFWNRDPETRAQQAEEALQAYQQALRHNPWSTEAKFGISRVYRSLGRGDEAVAVLRELVEQVPFHRDILVELGLQLRFLGRDREALDIFERARRLGPSEVVDLNLQVLRRRLESQGN